MSAHPLLDPEVLLESARVRYALDNGARFDVRNPWAVPRCISLAGPPRPGARRAPIQRLSSPW